MEADMLIVDETKADEILDMMSTLQMDYKLAVTVIVEEKDVSELRNWIKKGAHSVWTEQELMESLMTMDQTDTGTITYSEPSVLEYRETQTIIIAVGGVYGGAGSTHTALLIADYLSRVQKQPVALWECTENPTFQILHYATHGKLLSMPKFKWGKVTLIANNAEISMLDAVSAKFKYVVLDLGNLENHKHPDLFLKSDLPILVGSSSMWRIQENAKFCEQYSSYRQLNWRILLPLASKDNCDLAKVMLPGRFVSLIPFHPEVKEDQDDTDQVLEGVLSPILPKKHTGLFTKLLGI
jgi:Flp pilus assembly CpaE family ATPase